jgi:hypothetical protein
MKELKSNIKQNVTIRPQTITADAEGVAVDTQGYGEAVVILEVGAVSGSAPTLDVKIQESADGSTGWADVSGKTFTQVTAANNSQKLKLDLKAKVGARERYMRAYADLGGSSPSFAVSAVILMNQNSRQPIS